MTAFIELFAIKNIEAKIESVFILLKNSRSSFSKFVKGSSLSEFCTSMKLRTIIGRRQIVKLPTMTISVFDILNWESFKNLFKARVGKMLGEAGCVQPPATSHWGRCFARGCGRAATFSKFDPRVRRVFKIWPRARPRLQQLIKAPAGALHLSNFIKMH